MRRRQIFAAQSAAKELPMVGVNNFESSPKSYVISTEPTKEVIVTTKKRRTPKKDK
jgi:hypothetical protein